MENPERRRRIENALWGLFIGDALAMPVHWFYDRENIHKVFGGDVTDYEDAPHPHPESFMVGMEYQPDVEKAKSGGRPYDILHEHARFYDTSYSDLEIETNDRDPEHGNDAPAEEDRYHYHHGMKAGENTLGAHLVRVLLRSVVQRKCYDESAFLDDFVSFLTTPGNRADPYTEIYLRNWFENFAAGQPPAACAACQRDNWSIGSHGGMIRPMVLSLLAPHALQGLGIGLGHQQLTHRSENVASALAVAIPLLHDWIGNPNQPSEALASRTRELHPPQVTGDEMFRIYREHNGPGNIPDDEMWHLHVDLADEPVDLLTLAETTDENEVINSQFATACYPEHGLPLLLYQMAKHGFNFERSLLANANAGGDNVHRGMVMGLLVGAVAEEIPDRWIADLADSDSLRKEIEAFAEIAVSGGL